MKINIGYEFIVWYFLWMVPCSIILFWGEKSSLNQINIIYFQIYASKIIIKCIFEHGLILEWLHRLFITFLFLLTDYSDPLNFFLFSPMLLFFLLQLLLYWAAKEHAGNTETLTYSWLPACEKLTRS